MHHHNHVFVVYFTSISFDNRVNVSCAKCLLGTLGLISYTIFVLVSLCAHTKMMSSLIYGYDIAQHIFYYVGIAMLYFFVKLSAVHVGIMDLWLTRQFDISFQLGYISGYIEISNTVIWPMYFMMPNLIRLHKMIYVHLEENEWSFCVLLRRKLLSPKEGGIHFNFVCQYGPPLWDMCIAFNQESKI